MKPCNKLDYPEEDLICVLTAAPGKTGRRCQLTKKYIDGVKQKSYLAKEYTYNYFYVPGLNEYKALLKLLQKKLHSCIIHGLPKTSWKKQVPGKRNKDNINGIRDFRFLTFDIDGPIINNWTSDLDPKESFNFVYDMFANEMATFADSNLGCVIHLTSGWGDDNATGPRMRITFHLDQPISTKEMELFQKEIKRKYPEMQVDPAIYRPGQIVYTADPIGSNYKGPRVFLKKGKDLEWNDVTYGYDVQIEGYSKIAHKPASTFQTKLFKKVYDVVGEAGMIRNETEKMTYLICPWESEHSSHTHESSTAIFQTENGMPAFKCMHSSCDNNHWTQFLTKLQEDGILESEELTQCQHEDAVEDFTDVEPAKKSLKPIVRKRPSHFSLFDIKTNYMFIPTQNKFMDRRTGNLMTREGLDMLYPHIQNPHVMPKKNFYGKDELQGSEAWKYSLPAESILQGQEIDDFQWIPDRDLIDEVIQDEGQTFYNTYKGFGLEPEAGNTTVFEKHVKLLFPEEYAYEWFMNWLAHMIQKPMNKPTTAPVHIFRKQGLGRGLLHTFITNILNGIPAKKNLATTTTADVLLDGGQFNEHFFRRLYIGVEEIQTRRKHAGDALKDLVTATTMTINPKGMSKRENEAMYFRMFFMTNHIDGIPIDPTDRRFFVYQPPETTKEMPDGAYYTKLYNMASDSAVLGSILHMLQKRDISEFNVYKEPPMTSAKAMMADAHKSNGQRAIDRIREMDFPKCVAYTGAMMLEAAKLASLDHGYTTYEAERITPEIDKILQQWPVTAQRQTVAKHSDGRLIRRTLYFFNHKDYTDFIKERRNKEFFRAGIEKTRQAIKKQLKQTGLMIAAHADFEE